MLPSIPPTTLHDLARDYRGVPRDTDRRFTSAYRGPAKRRPRALLATNPIGALIRRVDAWIFALRERRYGTRIVSRSADYRPANTPVSSTRRAHDSIRDLALAA